MERRDEYIKRLEEEKRAEAAKTKAPTGDKISDQQRRRDIEKAEEDRLEAIRYAEAREKTIEKALEAVEPAEKTVTEYEALIKQTEALLEAMQELKDPGTTHKAVIIEEQKNVLKMVRLTAGRAEQRLSGIYATLHSAGKLETANKKKRGAFKNGI